MLGWYPSNASVEVTAGSKRCCTLVRAIPPKRAGLAYQRDRDNIDWVSGTRGLRTALEETSAMKKEEILAKLAAGVRLAGLHDHQFRSAHLRRQSRQS